MANTPARACPLAKKCGGCQLQNLSYDEQLHLKQATAIRLLGRFGGTRRVAASDSLTLRRFCGAARLIPCEPPGEALLFDAAELLREGGGYRIVFSEASLLKSEQECAIIGKYGRALPLGETIAHLRVRLEDIP